MASIGPRRVVQGDEHDPLAGPDRRGLGGDLHPGDEHLGLAAAAHHVGGAGHPQRGQERLVEVDDVPGRVQPEHLELGPDPLGPGHLRQPAGLDRPGGVAEVEGQLHRRGHHRARGLRLAGREGAHVRALHRGERLAAGRGQRDLRLPLGGRDRPASRRTPGPGARAGTAGHRPGPPVQLAHLQQQVATGQPARPAGRAGDHRPQRVERVEGAGEHQPLDHRAGHPGPVPEVGQRAVGPAGHHPGHLRLGDALHLRERQPDAVPRLHPLDPVGGLGPVDVQRQHLDAELAGVVEDQPLRVHAGVVGEHPGEERRRVVGLEPGRLVGRQRERRRVRLAEPERRERLEHRPDLVDGGHVVAAGEGPRPQPHLDLLLAVRAAHRPARLVGLGQGDPGEGRDDLEHLLVEDHHPAGVLEGVAQVLVQVLGLGPALPGPEERRDHVALDRPGPEQRDVGDQVAERLRAELADQLALPRRLDLEHAQGAGGLDQGEGGRVVEGHLLLVVQVDQRVVGRAVDPAHLVDRVRHRRLHPDAEHVELEQAELLDVVLVELAHREAQPAGLDRRAVQQRGVGQQHPARVQRDVPRQPVEPRDQPEQQVELSHRRPSRGRPQLGQLAQRLVHVAGPDVRERLGDLVDLARRHARAPRRRRGSRAAPGRCPSSRRRRPARRRTGRGSARRPRYAGPTRRRRRRRAAPARSGERNRSISRPCRIGSTPEMPSR